MRRREFIRHTATGMGAAWIGSKTLLARMPGLPKLSRKFSAADTVTLGKPVYKPAVWPWAQEQ